MHGIFLNYTYLGAGAGAQGGGAETKLGAAPTRWQYAEVVEESLRPGRWLWAPEAAFRLTSSRLDFKAPPPAHHQFSGEFPCQH